MSLTALLRHAFRALLNPRRILDGVPPGVRVPYTAVVLLMMLWGAAYAYLHFHAMEGVWLFQRYYGSLIFSGKVLTFALGSLTNWLLATVALAAVSSWRRWPLTLGQCEVAAFVLWTVWAVMPLLDQLHPLLHIPRRTFVLMLPWGAHLEFIGHVGWLFAFPVLCAQLANVCRRGLGVSWAGSLALAFGMLALGRMILETLVIHTQARLLVHGWHVNVWVLSAAHAALGLAQWGSMRLWLGGERRWPVWSVGGVAAAGGWVLLLW